jgi:NTF2 fold immunity protein
MKKSVLFILIYVLTQSYCMGQKTEQEVLKLRASYKNFNFLPDSGYIANKSIAISVGKIILMSIYGELLKDRTFDAHLIENDTIWVVFGMTPKGMKGGTAYIEIRKKDCQILKVANSK